MTLRLRSSPPRLRHVWGLMLTVLGASGCALGSAQLRPEAGRLEGCQGGPHCVSSTAQRAERYIEPFKYSGATAQAEQALRAALERLPRTRIVTQVPGYLHAEVSSPIMRYVDDVEFHFQPGNRIDVRSSSRIGYYDFQVNRERIERLRAGFNAGQR